MKIDRKHLSRKPPAHPPLRHQSPSDKGSRERAEPIRSNIAFCNECGYTVASPDRDRVLGAAIAHGLWHRQPD